MGDGYTPRGAWLDEITERLTRQFRHDLLYDWGALGAPIGVPGDGAWYAMHWARRNGKTTLMQKIKLEMERDMTAPRDVDLREWLNGVGFHPADTERKQLGHEAARLAVACLAHTLHQLLPPGHDKSIVFTLLEDVLTRSNRALANGKGPAEDGFTDDELRGMVAEAKEALALAVADAALPEDPRIGEYKADQIARGGTVPVEITQDGETWVAQMPKEIADGIDRAFADPESRVRRPRAGMRGAEDPGVDYDAIMQLGDDSSLRIRAEEATVVVTAEANGRGIGVGLHGRDMVEEAAAHLLSAANIAYGFRE